jgi:hypothetical protein
MSHSDWSRDVAHARLISSRMAWQSRLEADYDFFQVWDSGDAQLTQANALEFWLPLSNLQKHPLLQRLSETQPSAWIRTPSQLVDDAFGPQGPKWGAGSLRSPAPVITQAPSSASAPSAPAAAAAPATPSVSPAPSSSPGALSFVIPLPQSFPVGLPGLRRSLRLNGFTAARRPAAVPMICDAVHEYQYSSVS